MLRRIVGSNITRFLMLQLFLVAVLPVFADLVQGGRYVRVYSTECIDDNSNYVLLCISKGQRYMLSNVETSNGKKLVGEPTSSEFPNPNPSCIWKIKQDGTGEYYIQSSNGSRMCKGSSDTDVKIDRETGRNKLRFNISMIDSAFRFSVKDNEERVLSLSNVYKYYGLFINTYGECEDLELYRFKGDTLSLGEATDWNVASFVLGRDSSIVNFDDVLHPKLVDVSHYWLSTGELASDIPSGYHSAIDNKPVIPSPADSGGVWRLLHNIPVYFQDSICYTYAQNTSGEIIWSEVDKLDGLSLLPLQVIPVASKPDFTLSDSGTMHLLGGWSEPALKSLKVDKNITGIDITNTILPSSLPLLENAANPNCLYYIWEEDTIRLNALQKSVVACGKDNNRMFRSCVLTDKYPFAIDRNCSVAKGMISYVRDLTDSDWCTLYLPFSVHNVSSQIHMEEFDTITSEAVRFSVVDKIEAYHPLVFRSKLPRLQLDCDSQVLQPEPQPEALFCGTLHSLELSQGMALDSIGTNFVQCLSGSFVLPFRCYLLESFSQSLRVVSSIHYICNEEEKGYEYDLLGRGAHPLSPYIIRNRKLVRNLKYNKNVDSSRF